MFTRPEHLFTPEAIARRKRLDTIRAKHEPAIQALEAEYRQRLKPLRDARNAEIKAIEDEYHARLCEAYMRHHRLIDAAKAGMSDLAARMDELEAAMNAEMEQVQEAEGQSDG